MTGSHTRRIIFITGTDTGVGKTVLTALLLEHLRREDLAAHAIKPFCSGNRDDAKLLHSLQEGALTLDEINPFYFSEPLAPLAAARRGKSGVPMKSVLNHIQSLESKISKDSCLLIEGVGGLMVPLGNSYCVLDLILSLQCEVVVVAANKLGTINHTLLTVAALRQAGICCLPRQSQACLPTNEGPTVPRRSAKAKRKGATVLSKIVLMNTGRQDLSASSNPLILQHLLKPAVCVGMPHLGRNASSLAVVKKSARKFAKTLARILE